MNLKKFDYICRLSQKNLKKYVARELQTTHTDITVNGGYVFARGSFPVLLVAHLDTVHPTVPQKIYFDTNNSTLSSPQGIGGDDRCGVYMILEIVKHFNCSVLFCEDEEVGGIGASEFCKDYRHETFDFNYIIELDRKGSNDAVFYDCANDEFESFICKDYFKASFGTFSDISIIAPHLQCAAVNLSSGYYNAHTKDEYVVVTDVDTIVQEVGKILDRTTEADKFEYIEDVQYSRYTKYGWDDDWDELDEYSPTDNYYMIEYNDYGDRTRWETIIARSMDEAIGKFLSIYQTLTYRDIRDITICD